MKFGKNEAICILALSAALAGGGCGKAKDDLSGAAPTKLPETQSTAAAQVIPKEIPDAPHGAVATVSKTIALSSVLPELTAKEKDSIYFSVGLKTDGETTWLPMLTSALPRPNKDGLAYDEVTFDFDELFNQNLANSGIEQGKLAKNSSKSADVKQGKAAATKKFANFIKKIVACANGGTLRKTNDVLCQEKKAEDLRKSIQDIFAHDKKARAGLKVSENFDTRISVHSLVGLANNEFLKQLGLTGVTCATAKDDPHCSLVLSREAKN